MGELTVSAKRKRVLFHMARQWRQPLSGDQIRLLRDAPEEHAGVVLDLLESGELARDRQVMGALRLLSFLWDADVPRLAGVVASVGEQASEAVRTDCYYILVKVQAGRRSGQVNGVADLGPLLRRFEEAGLRPGAMGYRDFWGV